MDSSRVDSWMRMVGFSFGLLPVCCSSQLRRPPDALRAARPCGRLSNAYRRFCVSGGKFTDRSLNGHVTRSLEGRRTNDPPSSLPRATLGWSRLRCRSSTGRFRSTSDYAVAPRQEGATDFAGDAVLGRAFRSGIIALVQTPDRMIGKCCSRVVTATRDRGELSGSPLQLWPWMLH